jgi:hypothetical protein
MDLLQFLVLYQHIQKKMILYLWIKVLTFRYRKDYKHQGVKLFGMLFSLFLWLKIKCFRFDHNNMDHLEKLLEEQASIDLKVYCYLFEFKYFILE